MAAWLRHRDEEDGFTLVELLVVSVILPMVVGAIAVALVSVMSLQGGVSKQVFNSADAQTLAAHFDQDVQSALGLTTSSTVYCGSASGTQVLGLEWALNPSGSYQTVVSYNKVQTGTTSSLQRAYCASGASSTPTSVSTASFDIGASLPTIAPANSNASTGWISTVGVLSVTFAIIEPGSNYPYTLVALPEARASTVQQSVVPPATTTCGFALPGTGTYASTLCFVDFTSYSSALATGSGKCQTMTAAVPNTPYTLTFCLNVSAAGPVSPSVLPIANYTYLGNYGAYPGIPGAPALWQSNRFTTSTLSFTGIQLLDSNGSPATGWAIATGDAEATGPGESTTWSSSQNLSLLPNSPSSPIGNACLAADYTTVLLTGVGSRTVQCTGGVSVGNTGAVMLTAAAPSPAAPMTLTLTMVGNGRQASFFGLVLP